MATTLSLDYDRSVHGLPSGVRPDDLPALDFKPDAALTQAISDGLTMKRWRAKADARCADPSHPEDVSMSTMTLEPCPFCGKAGPFDQWPCEWLDATEANVVRCPHCHGAAPMATWNRRAHLAQPAQAVDVGAIREVIDRLRINPSITAQECADSLAVALNGEKAAPVDGEVLVAIERGESYEDVHPELVAEDCLGNATERGWRWRVVSASPAPDKEGW